MSGWMGTKSFMTSLAKSAMEEAQKTLDRALEIKEEYEAQERAVLEAQAADPDFVDPAWGSFTDSAYFTPTLSVSKSEPVSLQPKSEAKLPPPATNDSSSPSLMKEEELGPLHIDIQPVSPISSIEVLSPPTNDDGSMSSSHTTTLASSQEIREPGEGQEDEEPSLCNSQLLQEAVKESKLDHISEASSSSKSYEIINSSGKTSKPSQQNSSCSGDEFDMATTSSDIEIISNEAARVVSPRVSKSKVNRLGHIRSGSEISVCSQESSQSEVDRLLRKLSEMTELLDARETKMVEMSRQNLEFQEKNVDLESQVKEARNINSRLQESAISSEDFTLRLSTMERKLQQIGSERDQLKSENEKYKTEAAMRMPQSQIDEELKERDETIKDLRAEGESLSKQVGKQAEVIRKLRGKDKSSDKELVSLKEKLAKKTEENDRLRKNLSSKNEVESKQIEAVRDLTSANVQWEEETRKMTSELEDSRDQTNALKLSLESAYKEISELKRGLAEKENAEHELELAKEREARESVEEKLRQTVEQKRQEADHLFRQIDELRVALSSEERSNALKEDRMRREREELLKRLSDSEARHEELSASVSTATRPLLRQIESLQANLNEAQANSTRVERGLTERYQQASLQLASCQERERTVGEQYRLSTAKVSGLENRLKNANAYLAEAEAKIEVLEAEKSSLERSKLKESSSITALKKSFAEEVAELKKDKALAEEAMEAERSLLEEEKKKTSFLMEQLQDKDRRLQDAEAETRRMSEVSKGSPTPSQSASQIGSEHHWFDDVFETSSTFSNRLTSYDNAKYSGGNTTAVIESLQAQLKQREGETVQLQMEISGLERVKTGLSAELAKLNQKADRAIDLEAKLEDLRLKYQEVEQKYQTMLTMYGEKVEEAEELKLDLQDVKEMYKSQIQVLLRNRQC